MPGFEMRVGFLGCKLLSFRALGLSLVFVLVFLWSASGFVA